jgi:CheY-like chemotaxis protein
MPKRILIVDDDPHITAAFRSVLEDYGYIVQEENDPTKALNAARDFHPQTVLLDFLMPKLQGGDVAWQLASDPELRTAKVIVCSAAPRAEILLKLPPTQIPILAKPVDWTTLLQLIEQE